MATVQMVAGISGTRDGKDWPPPGGTLDVSESEASDLIGAGFAIAFDKKATPQLVEKAVAPRAETRKGLTKKDI